MDDEVSVRAAPVEEPTPLPQPTSWVPAVRVLPLLGRADSGLLAELDRAQPDCTDDL